MNQQIKELMGKTLDDKFRHTWSTMTHQDLAEFSEHFAELIVAECIETLRLVPYNSNVEFGDEVIYQDAIREHFFGEQE